MSQSGKNRSPLCNTSCTRVPNSNYKTSLMRLRKNCDDNVWNSYLKSEVEARDLFSKSFSISLIDLALRLNPEKDRLRNGT